MTHMDNPGGTGYVGNTATEEPLTSGPGSTGGVKEQTRQAAGTAADEGKHLTSSVGHEAQKVTDEAKQQGKVLLDDAKGQLEEQSRAQRDRAVQTLSNLGDDLDRMSSQADSGLASDLVHQAATKVRTLSNHLDGREPAELLGEVRDFARRRPGTFLFGALAAGVVAGRLARGAQGASGAHAPTSATTRSPGAGAIPPQAPGPVPTTPTAPALAGFPPQQPGEFR